MGTLLLAPSWNWIALYLFALDILVMVSVNSLFLYILFRTSSSVVIVVQAALVLFKLLWNRIFLPRLLRHLIHLRQQGILTPTTPTTTSNSSSSANWHRWKNLNSWNIICSEDIVFVIYFFIILVRTFNIITCRRRRSNGLERFNSFSLSTFKNIQFSSTSASSSINSV